MIWQILILIVLVILVFGVLPTIIVAEYVFVTHFKRTSKDIWKRGICSFPEETVAVQMFNEGMEWADKNKEFIKEVSIESEGFKLCGQYFDFGFKKSVLILAGRAEACTYSYYFAQPYKDFGYNVLVIDNRGHGLSDGKYNLIGLVEYKDVQKWINFLHEKLGNEKVLLHGICVGAATGVYAITNEGAPDCVEAIITEGMFVTFYESFKEHMVQLKKPKFPISEEIMCIFWMLSGKNPIKTGPIYSINKINVPILLLYGKEDQFSVPEKSKMLCETCKGDKTIVWFDKGDHSHLRINAAEKYDKTIEEFIEKKCR